MRSPLWRAFFILLLFLFLLFLLAVLMEQSADIQLGNAKIRDEQEADQQGENVIDGICNATGKDVAEQIKEGEDHGRGGDRQAAVFLGTAALVSLAVDLKNVEKGQTNDGAQYVKDKSRDAQGAVDTAKIENDGGEQAKANDVAQRVQLNAEVLFVLRAVLFGAGNGTIEHVAHTRQNKAKHGRADVPLVSQLDTEDA